MSVARRSAISPALAVALAAAGCTGPDRAHATEDLRPPSAPAAAAPEEPAAVPASANEAARAAPVTLAFVGDIALALQVGDLVQRRARGAPVPALVDDGYPFGGVRDRLARADLAVGNLECVISDKGQAAPGERSPLRAPLEAIAPLRASGLDVLSVANNHAHDFGPAARADMLARLEAAGLTALGAAPSREGPQEALVREIRGVRVGLLAYYHVGTREIAYEDVRRARASADVVVVFNHWGAHGSPNVQAVQRELGRGLVDAGADLVVGTHAHVLQPEERHRGKLIQYGLGNFVFAGMGFSEWHRTGGYLEVDVDRGGVRATRLHRVRLDDLGAPRWLD